MPQSPSRSLPVRAAAAVGCRAAARGGDPLQGVRQVRLGGQEPRDDQSEAEADEAAGQDRQLETGDHGVAAASGRVSRKRGSGLPVAMRRIQIRVPTYAERRTTRITWPMAARVRLDVLARQGEDDQDAGADERHPSSGRPRLGPIGLHLTTGPYVGRDRLGETFEDARQSGAAAACAEDEVRGDQVAGGVVEFVGEGPQRRLGVPSGTKTGDEPADLRR